MSDFIKIVGLQQQADNDIAVEIYDIHGQKVKHIRPLQNDYFDVSHIPNGIYFVQIRDKANQRYAWLKVSK